MSFEEKDMSNICIISANDGSEWGQFLSKEIQDLGNVIQHVVDTDYTIPWKDMNEDVTCIILSPDMLKWNKEFIQKSDMYISNPIIVLCGVPLRVMAESACCKLWKKCRLLPVYCSEVSADYFYRAVTQRLIEQAISNAVTLVPETVVQKANQSCGLLFSQPVFATVEVLIKGHQRKLSTKQTDPKTFIFKIPELTEGSHQLNVFVSNQEIPIKLSFDVMNPKPSKCSCDDSVQCLDFDFDFEDVQPLDDVLGTAMENDYSHRLVYQNSYKRNPGFQKIPTPRPFAAKLGLRNDLNPFLEVPEVKRRPGIQHNKVKNCLDMGKDTNYSSTLIPDLQTYCDEDTCMYMELNSKRNTDCPELPSPLHFAVKHGLCNDLNPLEVPGVKGGPGIKNDKGNNCGEDTYMYMALNSKRNTDSPELQSPLHFAVKHGLCNDLNPLEVPGVKGGPGIKNDNGNNCGEDTYMYMALNSKRNTDSPELQSPLHFAVKHGLCNDLNPLEVPGVKGGPGIKNDNGNNCGEDTYMYMALNSKRDTDSPELPSPLYFAVKHGLCNDLNPLEVPGVKGGPGIKNDKGNNCGEDTYMYMALNSKRDTDSPELPSPLHFAVKHGLCNDLNPLEVPGVKGGPGIKNDKGNNCGEDTYMYMALNSKENSKLFQQTSAYYMKG